MLNRFLTLSLLIFHLTTFGQLVKSVPFSLTTQIKPDGRFNSIKVSDNELVTLSKIKGGINGKSSYLIEKHDKHLEKKWSQQIDFAANETFLKFETLTDKLIMFKTKYDESNGVASLYSSPIDLSNGSIGESIRIHEVPVTKFKAQFGKGSDKEPFTNSIASCLNKGAIVPLGYQFHVRISPEKKKILTYIFDYSKSNLVASAKVHNPDFQKADSGFVPIDNGFVNYDIGLNDAGEVFIVNANKGGKIVVVQYHIGTRDHQLLDIQTSRTQRDNLKLFVVGNDLVYIASLNKKEDKLVGLTYAKFNFKTNLVERINFYEFNDQLKSGVTKSWENMAYRGKDDWKHYQITDFQVSTFGKITIILEKRFLILGDATYNESAANNPSNWELRAGTSVTGPLLMFSFNASDDLMWENYLVKRQETNLNMGLTSSSYLADFNLDDRIRIVHSLPTKGGVLNIMKYVEIDASTGTKHKNVTLENSAKLSLVRNYSIWFDNFDEEFEYLGTQLVLVGKKGLTGKKTFINLFKL